MSCPICRSSFRFGWACSYCCCGRCFTPSGGKWLSTFTPGNGLGSMNQNIQNARELWERTKRDKFAVGAFNVDNQETLKAIALAAKAKDSPVLVELSHGEVEAIGLHNVRCLVDNYKAEYGIEMYINLD